MRHLLMCLFTIVAVSIFSFPCPAQAASGSKYPAASDEADYAIDSVDTAAIGARPHLMPADKAAKLVDTTMTNFRAATDRRFKGKRDENIERIITQLQGAVVEGIRDYFSLILEVVGGVADDDRHDDRGQIARR